MPFVGKLFQRQGFRNFGPRFGGNTFNGSSSSTIKQNLNFNFKRSFHGFTKRAKLPDSNKWNAYDELKLFSYTSHLAFFMLLPPIIQMYTTKVEVTRDDTLHESPFESLPTGSGVMIRNINMSDMLALERDRLLNLYFKDAEKMSIQKSILPVRKPTMRKTKVTKDAAESVEKRAEPVKPNKIKRSTVQSNSSRDPEFDMYMNQVINAYSSLKHSTINETQYYSKIEKITDQILQLDKNEKKEVRNDTIKKIFDQLHNLQLFSHEIRLLRRIITSFDEPKLKLLNIRQKIISQYEMSKNKKQKKPIETPIHKFLISSKWISDYVSNYERFAQLVQMFAATKQKTIVFNSLFEIGLSSPEVREKIHDTQLRYSLVSLLRDHNRDKEALYLEKKMRNILSNNRI